MFLLPWSTGTASEKVLPKEVKSCGDNARTSSIVQIPLLNKAKRKRDAGGLAIPAMEPPPAKRRPEQATRKGRHDSVDMMLDNFQPPSCSDGNRSSSAEPKSNLGPAAKAQIKESHHVVRTESEQTSQARRDDCDPGANGALSDRGKGKPSGTHTRLNHRATNLPTLQQTIESQFNLEILLKHRELRLIDQELAKCQIALEQLRRCHIMPYPATTSDPDTKATVSMGTGPAYGTKAQHASPWGVTDGPYSRHYAKWLIPDPAFDGDVLEDMPPRRAGKGLPRANRGTKSQKAHPSSSSRAQRGSARERLHSLPHGYPEPKENKGPMIVRRSTDGQMVKLVCLDCRREDFSSAQGFINHCRIAHSHGFASHDAAAIACGEEVDLDSMGGVGEAVGNHASVALVHPLIRSANLTQAKPSLATSKPQQKIEPSQLLSSINGSSKAFSTPKPRDDLSGDNAATPSFKPSPQTPHLSALFARSGRSGDLDEMVTEARKQPDPDTPFAEDDDEDDDQETEDTPVEVNGHYTLGTRGMVRGGGRLPARSGMSPVPTGRPQSNKSTNNTNRRKLDQIHTVVNSTPYPNHYNRPSVPSVAGLFDHHSNYTDKSPADSSPAVNLSPNTIESHPAPSLVSDDGDYDNPHTDSEIPSSAVATDDEDTFDVEVKDHEHHAMDVDEPSGSSTSEFGIGKPHHGAPAPRRRAATGFRQSRTRKPPGGPRRKGGK